MLVTCKSCKKKVDRDSAYKIVIGGKNQYYCSEKEYVDEAAEKKAKAEVLQLCTEIMGNTTNTILFKDMTEISKVYSYVTIAGYLKNNKDVLQGFMNKNFNNEYGKIRYFTTIIKNNIGDYVPEVKNELNIEMETTEVNYKARSRKKSLSQYVAEYGM